MELRQYFSVVWKWLWLFVVCAVLAGAASYFATLQQPKLYQASTKLLVGTSLREVNPNPGDLGTSAMLAQTYIQLVKTAPVLQGAIDALGVPNSVDGLRVTVSATLIPGTQLIDLRVVDTDPQRAADLTNEIANQLSLQGPAAAEAAQAKQREFLQEQVSGLERKINESQQGISELETSLRETTSAREVSEKRATIDKIQAQIQSWQQSYSTLVTFLAPRSTNYFSVIEPAEVPTFAFAPNIPLNVSLAVIIALVLSIGAVFLLEYFDDTLKTSDDIGRVTGLSTIGQIATVRGAKGDKLVTASEPRSSVAEAYRVLRTNIQFSSVDKPIKAILITSAGPSEGKSMTASNLAVAMAQVGLRTVLVDCDLRKPAQHKIFGLANDFGLSNCLLTHASPDGFMRPTRSDNLRLLTTGPLPPNPAELLSSRSMANLVGKLSAENDIIIYDSPPTMPVADSAILSRLCDGVILVVSASRTRRDPLLHAKEIIEHSGGRILGIVLNRVNPRGGYYYYYRYGPGDKKSGRSQTQVGAEQPQT